MDRINSAGTILDANGHRIRQDQDLATGANGTELSAAYDNVLQESLIAGVIEAAGETPDASDIAQLMRCIQKLIPHRGPIGVASSGSTTIPAGVNCFHFGKATGGGGGGGGSYDVNSGATGGAGSPWASGSFPVKKGDVVSWTIGAAGGGGAAGNPASNGGAGGTTTIYLNGVAMVTVTGGTGGWEGTGGLASNSTAPGTVTVASGVDVSVTGGAGGQLPFGIGSGYVASGVGGPSGAGAYSAQSVGSVATAGQNAASHGGGGGGGLLGGTGGQGGAGFFEYWW